MKLSLTEICKSVGEKGIVGEEQEFNFGHTEFQVSIEYLSGDVELEVEY